MNSDFSNLKKIEARVGISFLRADGIIQVDILAGAEIRISDAIELIEAQTVFAAGKKRPLFIDASKLKSMSRDARNHFGQKQAAENVTALALLTNSPVSRVIGNFFMGLNKPIFPTRLFSSETDAISWLNSHLNEK